MLACAQLTVRDENDIRVAATAPTTPVANELWLDTSADVALLKRWDGTGWAVCGVNPAENEIVVGTQTAATGAWTGVAGFAPLRDGRQITYWLPYNGSGSASLNLTLADGTATGAVPCYYGGTGWLTTHYAAGNALRLCYRENVKIGSTTIARGWWADANYDTNTTSALRFQNALKAKSAIASERLIVGDGAGYFPLAAGAAFDVTKPILYAGSAIAAGATGTNNYLAYTSVTLRNNQSGFTGTIYETCYLVGTLAGNAFTPGTPLFTTTKPTTEDGKTYIALGQMASAYQIYLYPEHPMYRYLNGAFKPLSQIGYEAHEEAGALQAELTTAIEQTSEAIALKANQSDVSALGTRVTNAESAITLNASAIESVVSGKNRTYVQFDAPTQGLLTGDLWVEYLPPSLWSDADDGTWSALAQRAWRYWAGVAEPKSYVWRGSAWLEAGDMERMSEFESRVTQTAEALSSKVSKGSVISEINQSAESVSIAASKINLNGAVTANERFQIKTDGSMEAKDGVFDGLKVKVGSQLRVLGATENDGLRFYISTNATGVAEIKAVGGTSQLYLTADDFTFQSASGGVDGLYVGYGANGAYLQALGTGSSNGTLGTSYAPWQAVYAASYPSVSSRERKEAIADVPDAGAMLDQLRPVLFRYRGDPTGRTHYGLLWEEAQPVIPILCTADRDETPESRAIDYHELSVVLLKEVQALRARVQALEQSS